MGEIRQILENNFFYLFSKVILAVSKVRHLPHLPPLRYGHEYFTLRICTTTKVINTLFIFNFRKYNKVIPLSLLLNYKKIISIFFNSQKIDAGRTND